MSTSTSRPKSRPFLSVSPAAFKAGTDDPRKLLERCLAEIDARESGVLALTAIDKDTARAQADASAQRWKAGKPLSQIDGMPVGVKDVIETINMPTEMGSPLYKGYRSNRDSATVFALKEAGAVIVAKTVTTEFAASEPGPTRNPWDLSRTPGGSSSGSAAGVAAGYFPAALGSQVVGSILRPSSYCGVVGYKPTFGAINRGGSHDTMSQSVQGVLAATLADAWAVMREVGDRCGGDPGQQGLFGPPTMPAARKPKSLVFLETAGWAEASDGSKAAFEKARKRLVDAGISVKVRKGDAAIEAAEQAVTQSMALTRSINAWESRWPLNTYRDRDAAKLSKAMRDRAAEAEGIGLSAYRELLARRLAVRAAYARLAGIGEAAITLSAGSEAPVGLASTGLATFVVVGSLLGVPTVSLPVLGANGLPLGLQVMGYEHKDGELFATAAAIEEIVGTADAVRA